MRPPAYRPPDSQVSIAPSVFLAHSSADKDLVRSFHRTLQIDGFRPWFDEADLVVGQDWQLEVEKAVRRSDTIAMFLSERSVDGRGYVHKELALALDVAESEPEGSIFILPIRLDNVAVPTRLAHLHYLYLYDKSKGIGRTYLGLQRGLISRAHQLDTMLVVPHSGEQGEKPPSPKGEVVAIPIRVYGPKGGAITPPIRVNWPGVSYLVHGFAPSGEEYVGTAALQVVGGSALLTAEIGREILRYSGKYRGETLTFSGPHEVTYDALSPDGVLRGSWGGNGFEELIPASPYARCTDGAERST